MRVAAGEACRCLNGQAQSPRSISLMVVSWWSCRRLVLLSLQAGVKAFIVMNEAWELCVQWVVPLFASAACALSFGPTI